MKSEMSSPTKKQKNNTDEEVLSTSQENLDISQDSTGSGDVGSVSRKKKKRKSKHENTCDEGESKRKHKTWSEPEQGEKVEPEEEWPQLGAGDSHRHKRKKPSEADVHKERPNVSFSYSQIPTTSFMCIDICCNDLNKRKRMSLIYKHVGNLNKKSTTKGILDC